MSMVSGTGGCLIDTISNPHNLEDTFIPHFRDEKTEAQKLLTWTQATQSINRGPESESQAVRVEKSGFSHCLGT